MRGKVKAIQNIKIITDENYKESETQRNSSTTANKLVVGSILRSIVKTLIVLWRSKWAKPQRHMDRKHEQYLNEAVTVAAITVN